MNTPKGGGKLANRRRISPGSVAGALGLVVFVAGATIWFWPVLHIRVWLNFLIQNVSAAGPVWFFTAMAVLPAIGVPIAPFNLAAGPAFSAPLGLPIVIGLASLATAVNVSVTYALARHFLRPLLAKLVDRLGYKVPEIPPSSTFTFILLVRVTPGPPFFMQGYLLGLAATPFSTYFIVSWLVGSLYGTGTILLGDSLLRGRPKILLAAVCLLGALILGVRWFRQRMAARHPAAVK